MKNRESNFWTFQCLFIKPIWRILIHWGRNLSCFDCQSVLRPKHMKFRNIFCPISIRLHHNVTLTISDYWLLRIMLIQSLTEDLDFKLVFYWLKNATSETFCIYFLVSNAPLKWIGKIQLIIFVLSLFFQSLFCEILWNVGLKCKIIFCQSFWNCHFDNTFYHPPFPLSL